MRSRPILMDFPNEVKGSDLRVPVTPRDGVFLPMSPTLASPFCSHSDGDCRDEGQSLLASAATLLIL